MTESLFNIFGDHLNLKVVKNDSRQPSLNVDIENRGKVASVGPIKLNESVKKPGESKVPKKSFLCNTGKALQSTPARSVFTPRSMNVGALIYTDENSEKFNFEDLEFTAPVRNYDSYHCELFDYLPKIEQNVSPPSTPPPKTLQPGHDLVCSYQDEFFTDDFSMDSLDDEGLGLPELY